MNTEESNGESGLAARFKKEMREYLYIAFYLWVCFSVLALYEGAMTGADNIALVPLGAAAFKAFILGKFILIGKAIKFGERMSPSLLLHRIAWKSVAMLLLLLIFKALEEIIKGLVHGHPLTAVATELLERSWVQNVAPPTIMLLVLIPLIAYEEFDKALGKGRLRQMLMERAEKP